jgi:hypothetical protein
MEFRVHKSPPLEPFIIHNIVPYFLRCIIILSSYPCTSVPRSFFPFLFFDLNICVYPLWRSRFENEFHWKFLLKFSVNMITIHLACTTLQLRHWYLSIVGPCPSHYRAVMAALLQIWWMIRDKLGCFLWFEILPRLNRHFIMHRTKRLIYASGLGLDSVAV